jgi:hypothetical protein
MHPKIGSQKTGDQKVVTWLGARIVSAHTRCRQQIVSAAAGKSRRMRPKAVRFVFSAVLQRRDRRKGRKPRNPAGARSFGKRGKRSGGG